MSTENGLGQKSQRSVDIVLLSLAVITTLVVVFASVTGRSLWLDEYISYSIANKPDFSSWASDLISMTSSDVQKPAYHFYLYLWSQLFGLSEYSMRLANTPWLLVGVIATAWSFRREPLLAGCIIFASACHPLLWFYMNDAQPYAMVYASTMLCLAGLNGIYHSNQGHYSHSEQRWTLVLLCFGIFLLSSATMLGVAWAGIFLLLAIWCWWSGPALYRLTKSDLGILCVFCAAMVALGSLYLYTLIHGAGATRLHQTNVLTTAFSVYEVLGLGGLGPGRDDIRVDGISTFIDHLPKILIGGTIIVAFLGYAIDRLLKRIGLRQTLLLTGAVMLPTLFTVAAGYEMHWRVLGRHIIPAAVIVSYLAAFGLWNALLQKNIWGRFAAVAFVTSFVYSAVSYTAPHHAKEDFLHATQLASEFIDDDYSVWWVAFAPLAQHYGLRVSLKEREYQCIGPVAPGTAIVVRNLSTDCLETLAAPDVIFFSRPDANDLLGTISDYVVNGAYEHFESLPGFRVWRRVAPMKEH